MLPWTRKIYEGTSKIVSQLTKATDITIPYKL